MPDNYRKTTWEFDPRWIRIEPLDDFGNTLGFVCFEPNHEFQLAQSSAGSTNVFAALTRVWQCTIAMITSRAGAGPLVASRLEPKPGRGRQITSGIDTPPIVVLRTVERYKRAVPA